MEIVLNDRQLKNLQEIELEMLIELDRICKKNNITYVLIGGSLLGSERHKGFIPWDDDADVAMLRDDYERFIEACKTDLDTTRFYFQDMNNTAGYRWGYGKLRRKNTLFLRDGQEHMPYEQGVFLDIFPEDAVADNIFLKKIQLFHCFCFRKIMWSEVGKRTEKNFLMRWWYVILSKIPEQQIKKYINKYISFCNKKYTNSNLVRTYLFPLNKGLFGYPRVWYENSEEVIFEGINLQASKYRINYLKTKFGEHYMELPPVEKRQCHPVSQLKLLEK